MANSDWIAGMIGLSAYFPRIGISKERKERIENDFARGGAKIIAERYMALGIALSFATSIVLSIATYAALSLKEIPMLFFLFVVIFAICVLGFLSFPKMFFERNRKIMESDLPLAIRHAGIAISIRLPFEKVILELGEAGYGCSEIFGRAGNAIKSGQTVQKALLGEAALAGSRKLTRFASSIISIYEEGGEPVTLFMLADEYARDNISSLKEFAQKAVFGGLVFVTAACVIPSFYMIYGIIAGAMPLGFEQPSAFSAWAAFLVLFPIIDLAILLGVTSGTPPSLNLRKDNQESNSRGREIKVAGITVSQTSVQIASGAGFVLFLMLGALNSLFFGFAALFAVVPFAYMMLLEFEEEKKTAELEAGIGDALVMASTAPKGAPIEKIALTIASFATGPIAQEFGIVKNQIASGVSPKSALSNVAQRTDSLLIHRCISLMLLGYKSGADMRVALRKVAEDVYSTFDQLRERKNAIAMQKYTLLAGSALLVPLVMGIAIGMSKVIGKSGVAGSGASIDMMGPSAAYIIIFALLSAIYSATLEGNSKKAVIYFLLAGPLALLVLILSSGMLF